MSMRTRSHRKSTGTGVSGLLNGAVPLAGAACLSLLTGCRQTPTISILGSYFPAWLLCFATGVLLAFLLHLLLIRLGLSGQLRPTLLVYPALATSFTLSLWLLFFD